MLKHFNFLKNKKFFKKFKYKTLQSYRFSNNLNQEKESKKKEKNK